MNDSYHKYPRTRHLPWSKGQTDDDKTFNEQELLASRLGQSDDIVVSEKYDGENASLYRDHYHARSLDSRHHPSRDWIKQLQGRVGHQIPEGWRICGENMYAEHSIRYENLESYFYVFSIWNDENETLSWDETVEWCEMLDLVHVPVLYRGPYDEEKLREIAGDINPETQEGYVARISESFSYDEFSSCLAKYVREDHVQTDEHWMHKEVVPNSLKDE